jgi:hypothetical protein
MEPSALVVGHTYYQLTFADRDLTMPGVEPLVFLGEVDSDDEGHAFAFQDTVSYVRFGSRLELSEDNEEIVVYFLSETDVRSLRDVAMVASETAAAAERAESLGHPVLKVLRTGWKGAP